MTKKMLVENYVFQIDKAFCLNDICIVTGVSYSTASKEVSELKIRGKLKIVSRMGSTYYYRYISKATKTKDSEPLSFNPKIDKLKAIYDLIGRYPRIADIINSVPYSKTTVWRYVKILHLDGCITRDKGAYYQKEFSPSGRVFGDYPRVNRHYRRQGLIEQLKHLCVMGKIDTPNVEKLTNKEIISLTEKIQPKVTQTIINNWRLSHV